MSELEQQLSNNQRDWSNVSWTLTQAGSVPHNTPLEELRVKVNRIDTDLDGMQAEMNDSAI